MHKFARRARLARMTTDHSHERIPAFGVGDRLRKAREKTGLDQEAFSAELGISRGTVSNYERATTAVGLKRPYLMAWALRADVPVEWLLTGKVPAGGDDGPAMSVSVDTCEYPDQIPRLAA